MNMIPTFEYLNKDEQPVASPADPEWYYTVINGTIRTGREGVPQKLVDGKKWVDIEKK